MFKINKPLRHLTNNTNRIGDSSLDMIRRRLAEANDNHMYQYPDSIEPTQYPGDHDFSGYENRVSNIKYEDLEDIEDFEDVSDAYDSRNLFMRSDDLKSVTNHTNISSISQRNRNNTYYLNQVNNTDNIEEEYIENEDDVSNTLYNNQNNSYYLNQGLNNRDAIEDQYIRNQENPSDSSYIDHNIDFRMSHDSQNNAISDPFYTRQVLSPNDVQYLDDQNKSNVYSSDTSQLLQNVMSRISSLNEADIKPIISEEIPDANMSLPSDDNNISNLTIEEAAYYIVRREIRDWLDKNLKDIVNHAVSHEIALLFQKDNHSR